MAETRGFRFKITGLAEATGRLRAAMLAGIESGLDKLGIYGEQIWPRYAPVGATGNLAHGMEHRFSQEGMLMHETLSISPPADVYAAPVEFGTRPHFPPVEALRLWVEKKMHVTSPAQAKSVAFLIARAIARRGTKGQFMFDRLLAQLQVDGPGILEREIAAAVERAGFKAN